MVMVQMWGVGVATGKLQGKSMGKPNC